VLALLLLLIVFSVLWFTRPAPSPEPVATVVLYVVRVPTKTPVNVLSTPAYTPTPTPLPGAIVIGSRIRITGTGDDGLRLRLDPGLDSQIMFIAPENGVFVVKDGPREGEGYLWWYLVGVDDDAMRGWAVSDFMETVPEQ